MAGWLYRGRDSVEKTDKRACHYIQQALFAVAVSEVFAARGAVMGRVLERAHRNLERAFEDLCRTDRNTSGGDEDCGQQQVTAGCALSKNRLYIQAPRMKTFTLLREVKSA